MLVEENLRSLRARYPGRDFLQEWEVDAATFSFRKVRPHDLVHDAIRREAEFWKERGKEWTLPDSTVMARVVTATQIIKACDCYDYQACETDDYRDSVAAEYVGIVRDLACQAGGQKEGPLYDVLIWGL